MTSCPSALALACTEIRRGTWRRGIDMERGVDAEGSAYLRYICSTVESAKPCNKCVEKLLQDSWAAKGYIQNEGVLIFGTVFASPVQAHLIFVSLSHPRHAQDVYRYPDLPHVHICPCSLFSACTRTNPLYHGDRRARVDGEVGGMGVITPELPCTSRSYGVHIWEEGWQDPSTPRGHSALSTEYGVRGEVSKERDTKHQAFAQVSKIAFPT